MCIRDSFCARLYRVMFPVGMSILPEKGELRQKAYADPDYTNQSIYAFCEVNFAFYHWLMKPYAG